MISGIHSILKEALNVIQYSRIISYYKPKQYSNVEYIYVVNDSQVVGNPIPTWPPRKKWRNEEVVCRKPEKIIDREFVNNFSNHVPPPPPGQKEVHCL